MKKIVILGLLVSGGWVLSAVAATPTQMSVQVKKGPVRSAPSYTGSVVGSLAYGDRVNILERRPGWAKVSAGSTQGWMHQSALSQKRIVLRAGDGTARTGASSEELALAGKGFNSDVEAKYKAQNKALNYAAVDRLEKRTVTAQEKARFLAEGAVR